jgi:hypothetical protein
MPVPTLITDLSTTIASNSPAGSESARGTVDDYLRAHAAFIAQTRAGTSATTYTFSGTAARIQGDFSNATLANRTSFQDKTTNGETIVNAFPNGTSRDAGWYAWNTSDPTNSPYIALQANVGQTGIYSYAAGSGTALPLTLNVNNTESARFDTSGNFLHGTTSANGLVGNLKKTVGGIFSTVNGSVSAASGNGTSLFVIPDVNASMWIVSAQLQAGDTGNYSALAIIATQNGSFRFISNVAGALLTISQGAGLIVQATQSSGGTNTIFYSAIRVM